MLAWPTEPVSPASMKRWLENQSYHQCDGDLSLMMPSRAGLVSVRVMGLVA